jgi:hypothetical protein
MSTKSLAEAVILQCMEDLWDERYCDESKHFFLSEKFSILADIANMSMDERLRLLHMVKKINTNAIKSSASKADRANSSPLALSAPPIF